MGVVADVGLRILCVWQLTGTSADEAGAEF